MRNKQITPNFKLSEFIREQDELPSSDIIANIVQLANRLQVIRDVVGKPITITSGYRIPSHNKAVGGGSRSFHLKGMAADIVVSGMSARAVQKLLKNWSGGLGSYETFTHIDTRKTKARWSL